MHGLCHGVRAVLFARNTRRDHDFQRGVGLSQQVFAVKVVPGLAEHRGLDGRAPVVAAAVGPTPAEFQRSGASSASPRWSAWTIFFSLLLHGPLKAAILGVTASSFVTYFLLRPRIEGIAALEPRAAVLAIVAVVDCVLGWRWFRDCTCGRSSWTLWTGPLTSLWPAGVPALPSRGSILGRLVWQQWRDSGWMLGMLGVLAALTALPAAMIAPHYTQPSYVHLSSFPGGQREWFVYWNLWLLGTIGSSLLGVFTFRVDQRLASLRFLANRGVSPRMVWLSRQLAWLCLIVLGTAVLLLLAAIWAKAPNAGETVPRWWAEAYSALPFFHAGRVLLLVILACALGQFCSMLLRSGILARCSPWH